MLERTSLAELQRALEALQRLISIRLEERGALAANSFTGSPGRLAELAGRPLGTGRGEALPDRSVFEGEGPLGALVAGYDLDAAEATALVAALAPEVDEKFDLLYTALGDRPQSDGLTGETLRTLLARTLAGRSRAADLLAPSAKLRGLRMLTLDPAEPALAGRIAINPELGSWLLGREGHEPEFSPDFPAQRLRTVHTFDDLVLPHGTRDRLREVLDRIALRPVVLGEWGFARSHDNAGGLHVLFHGPAGTGKTTAAAVIGRETGLPVYRVNIASVVSKYIGETPKNLDRIFQRAEARNWIMFFDEADALFGRRAEVEDARDRYANQEVSYLLQRIESFDGITILATNLLANIDEAFHRRIHVEIGFPQPAVRERARLWRTSLPEEAPRVKDLDLTELARRFELSGGEIRNAVFHAAFRAAAEGESVGLGHLLDGAQAEYEKGGRLVPQVRAP